MKTTRRKPTDKQLHDDTYSLYMSLSRWISPRLYYFAEHLCSTPIGMDYDVWRGILCKMADGFELLSKDCNIYPDKKTARYIEQCLDLFREYFLHLWD